MSHAVLSDDESDHESGTNLGQGRYAIVREAWRSNELIIWLRLIDLLACGEKWDGRNVARQGNSRRLRVHSSRLKDGVAMAGLPANCYDSHWLNSLKPHERELLNVQAPLDMQFSDEERRCVFHASGHLTGHLIRYTFICVGRPQNISHLRMERLHSGQRTPTSVASINGSSICSENCKITARLNFPLRIHSSCNIVKCV